MQAVLKLLKGRAVAAAAQAEADVAGHREMGIERIALEHHGHVSLGWAQRAHGPIAHVDLPLAGLL